MLKVTLWKEEDATDKSPAIYSFLFQDATPNRGRPIDIRFLVTKNGLKTIAEIVEDMLEEDFAVGEKTFDLEANYE